MARKIGEDFVDYMVEKGRCEVGGFFYPDSNIGPQPNYPLRGQYGASKEPDSPSLVDRESEFDRLHPVEASRDDFGLDDPDRGIDRE